MRRPNGGLVLCGGKHQGAVCSLEPRGRPSCHPYLNKEDKLDPHPTKMVVFCVQQCFKTKTSILSEMLVSIFILVSSRVKAVRAVKGVNGEANRSVKMFNLVSRSCSPNRPISGTDSLVLFGNVDLFLHSFLQPPPPGNTISFPTYEPMIANIN